MGERLEGAFGGLLFLAFMGFGLLQLGAGWAGIEDAWGWGWGLAAVIAALAFRFTIPIVLGAFICANNLWEWHWFFALLFALPGLLFMIPALFASALGALKS